MRFRSCKNQKSKQCSAVVENRPRSVIFGALSWGACQHDSMSKRATISSSRNSRRNLAHPNYSWTRIKSVSHFIFYAHGQSWKSGAFTQRGISVARWSRRHAEKKETARPSRMDHGHTGGVSMDAEKPSDSAFVR